MDEKMDELFEKISEKVSLFTIKARKAINGDKAAGVRSRKISLEIDALLKRWRVVSNPESVKRWRV